MTREPSSRHDPGLDAFEQDLRRVLAESAAEPAPEPLKARIAAIPTAPHAFGSRMVGGPRSRLADLSRSRFGLGLSAIAAAAAVIVAGSLLVGRLAPPSSVGNPSTIPVVVSPSASVVGPSPSSPEPSQRPSAAAPGPIGGPVPADFRPVSATFITADDGWVLGSATCAGAPCAAIARTTDGGHTWVGIPAPDVPVVTGDASTPGVREIRFADARNGWALGPDLWVTHDGGTTWHRVQLPGGSPDPQVMALESAGATVHAIYFRGGSTTGLAIATSPIGNDGWVASQATVELGAGPVPRPQLVLDGAAGWLVEVDRTVVDGARFASGSWVAWTPPCLDLVGPAILAASTSSDLVAACDVGLWSNPSGVHVFASLDGGASFRETGSGVPVSSLDGVAAPAPGAILVAGGRSGGGSAIVASFNGGKDWESVQTLPASVGPTLSFTSPQDGFALSGSGDGASELWLTRDGGRTWSAVSFKGG